MNPKTDDVSETIQNMEVDRKEFEAAVTNLLRHPPRPKATVSAHIHTRREQSKRQEKPLA